MSVEVGILSRGLERMRGVFPRLLLSGWMCRLVGVGGVSCGNPLGRGAG